MLEPGLLERERSCDSPLSLQRGNLGHGFFTGIFDSKEKRLVQCSCSIMSNSLRPHGLQHARLPCPSPAPRACSNSTSVKLMLPSKHPILCRPFSSCLQSFPASGSFPMSQFFVSDGQTLGVSASALVLPVNAQD